MVLEAAERAVASLDEEDFATGVAADEEVLAVLVEGEADGAEAACDTRMYGGTGNVTTASGNGRRGNENRQVSKKRSKKAGIKRRTVIAVRLVLVGKEVRRRGLNARRRNPPARLVLARDDHNLVALQDESVTQHKEKHGRSQRTIGSSVL